MNKKNLFLAFAGLLIFTTACRKQQQNVEYKNNLENKIWECVRIGEDLLDKEYHLSDSIFYEGIQDSLLRPFSLHFREIKGQYYVRGKAVENTLLGSFSLDTLNGRIMWNNIQLTRQLTADSTRETEWLMKIIQSDRMELLPSGSLSSNILSLKQDTLELIRLEAIPGDASKSF